MRERIVGDLLEKSVIFENRTRTEGPTDGQVDPHIERCIDVYENGWVKIQVGYVRFPKMGNEPTDRWTEFLWENRG